MTKRIKPKPAPIPTSPALSPSAPPQPKSKRKRWSKWLKFTGALILLSAFGMQMRQDEESTKATERMQAAELDARAHIKALEYENLYYSVKANGTDNPDFLRLAAMNYRVGRIAVMVTSPGDRAEIAADIKKLDAAVAAVHNVASFQEFMLGENLLTSKTQKIDLAGLIDAHRAASHFGSLYLLFYALGSIIALIGQALD